MNIGGLPNAEYSICTLVWKKGCSFQEINTENDNGCCGLRFCTCNTLILYSKRKTQFVLLAKNDKRVCKTTYIP